MPQNEQQRLNASLVQMIISDRMQQKAEERRAQQAMQEALLTERAAKAKEQRDFMQKIAFESFKQKNKAAETGGQFSTEGQPPDAVQTLLATQAAAQREQAVQGATQAQLSRDPNAIMTANLGAEQIGIQRGDPDFNAEVVRRLGVQLPQQQVQLQQQAEKEGVTQGISAETQALNTIRDEVATQIATNRLGFEGMAPFDARSYVSQLYQLHPDIDENKLMRAVSEGLSKATVQYGRELWKQRTADAEPIAKTRARAAEIYYQAEKQGDVNWLERLTPDERGAVLTAGDVAQDVLTGYMKPFFGNQAAARNFEKDRAGFISVVNKNQDLEKYWLLMNDYGDRSKISGIVGTPGVQQWLTDWNIIDPYAAAYISARNDAVLYTVKATSGARGSDMDLSTTAAMYPQVSESGSASGTEKLGRLHVMTEMMLESPYDPAVRKRLRDWKNRTKTRETVVYEAALKSYENAKRVGNQTDIDRATAVLADAEDKWRASGGPERDSLLLGNEKEGYRFNDPRGKPAASNTTELDAARAKLDEALK